MKSEQIEDNLSDISNEEIRKIVKKNGWKLGNIKEMKEEKIERKKDQKNKQKFLMEIGERKWLGKHGRKFLINFDEKERKDMKEYFKALDKKNHGSIGIQELEELLISVGLAETREEVKKLIDSVDQDHSGKIEFDQFLDLIQSQGQGEGQYLINFFKKIISHTLDKDIPQNLSFQLVISNIRRKKMMNALNIHDVNPDVQRDGVKVLNAYKTMNEKRLIRKIRQEERNRLVRQMLEKNEQR